MGCFDSYQFLRLQFVDVLIKENTSFILVLHRYPHRMLGKEFVNSAECGVMVHVGIPSKQALERWSSLVEARILFLLFLLSDS